jgi:hypothetical protein
MRPRLRWLLPAFFLIAACAFAQNSCDFDHAPGKEPTSAVAELRDSTSVSASKRVSEKRAESGNRTIVTRTLESVSVNGGYAPVAICEDETVRVDANTTRHNLRSYGIDFDGRRFLIETVEEQNKRVANGGEDHVRTITRQDENGRLRVARREIEKVRPVDANQVETDTTVLLPDINTASLVPNAMTVEIRRQQSPGVETIHRAQLLPSGNGEWQLGEVREEVVKTDPNGNRTIEQQVSAPDLNGKLSVSERTVTHDTKNGAVESRQTDRYLQSIEGTLVLDSEMRVVQTTGPGGTQVKSELDTRNPISTSDGLRPSAVTVQTSSPNAQGGQNVSTSTSVADPNGSMKQVTVGFGQSTKDAKQANDPAENVGEGSR